jgi:hypothetical protein
MGDSTACHRCAEPACSKIAIGPNRMKLNFDPLSSWLECELRNEFVKQQY